MSTISAPVLLHVPKNFKPNWQRVFESLVSPIHLIRSIIQQAHQKHVAEPWLSEEELKIFRIVAKSVDQKVLRTLNDLHGATHRYKSWLAGRNIRDSAQMVFSPLKSLEYLDRTPHPSHRDHFLAESRKVIENTGKFHQIPSLKKLLKAMTEEGGIDFPSSAGDNGIGISASLVQAIDDLLAFVRQCEAEHRGISSSKMPRFQELDLAVIIPTYSKGFSCLIPDKGRFDRLLDPDAAGPTVFLGSTNLPGDFDNGIFVCAPESWTARMATLREFAAQQVIADAASEAPTVVAMTWQEAATRMKRLKTQGEQFTSQSKLANAFGCSSGTINKAIKKTPSLQAWAKPEGAIAPKAQSLSGMKRGEYVDIVTDRTPSSELDPVDDAAIREYLEREDLEPEARAFFNSLSCKDQLDFLDDPDKHQKILGRRP